MSTATVAHAAAAAPHPHSAVAAATGRRADCGPEPDRGRLRTGTGTRAGTTGRAYACGKWGAPTDDARALQPPGVSHAHTIAGVSSKGWASFHVDVLAAPTSSGRKYNLTLYMVDFDREHIRLGVKAMRMEGAHTINSSNTTSTAEGRQLGHAATIAPMVLVQDFDAGAC